MLQKRGQIQFNKNWKLRERRKVMLTILNSESLWIGTDMIQFNAIRDILDREKIKYKYKTYNHLGEWAGSGTLRGNLKWWESYINSPYSMKFCGEKRLRKSTGCNVEFA